MLSLAEDYVATRFNSVVKNGSFSPCFVSLTQKMAPTPSAVHRWQALLRPVCLTCLRNGMNIYVLARLMGHSDITVLRQYLALAEVDLQKAHKEFGAVDRMLG